MGGAPTRSGLRVLRIETVLRRRFQYRVELVRREGVREPRVRVDPALLQLSVSKNIIAEKEPFF
jgi:hypothetical protein